MCENRIIRNIVLLIFLLQGIFVNAQEYTKQTWINCENDQVVKEDILNANNHILLSKTFDFIEGFSDTVKGIEYFDNGLRMRYDLISPFANLKSFYKYDDKNNMIKSLTVEENSTDSIFVFFENYYSGELLDSTYAKVTNDSIVKKVIYTYNSKGLLVKDYETLSIGYKLSEYQYNEKDSLVFKTEIEQNTINGTTKETQSKFENGNLIKKVIVKNKELTEEIDYKYLKGEIFEVITNDYNLNKTYKTKIIKERTKYTPMRF